MKTNRKKKIMYVVTKSNFGGAQRYVYELATTLSNNENEVVVACGGHGTLVDMLRDASIRVIPIPSFERDVHLDKEVRAFFELIHIIQNERPDIIHLNSSKAGGIGALAARVCGVSKIIFTAHGWPFFEKKHFLWKIAVWILSYTTALLSHKVILVSAYDATHMHMPFVEKKVVEIHTGVGKIAFLEREQARTLLFTEEECACHENDLWLVSTGEHTANKNLFALLEAMRTYNASHDQKLFLTLMGDGEDRSRLEAYAREHGIETHVHFTGFVSGAPQYLKTFDVFVLPSLKEGLPYGLLEAGAAGLPVIASNVGGIPEVIEHGKSGLLIDPQSTESLTHALTTLTGDEAKRHAFGAALCNKVTTNFSLSKMIKETQKLYIS